MTHILPYVCANLNYNLLHIETYIFCQFKLHTIRTFQNKGLRS